MPDSLSIPPAVFETLASMDLETTVLVVELAGGRAVAISLQHGRMQVRPATLARFVQSENP